MKIKNIAIAISIIFTAVGCKKNIVETEKVIPTATAPDTGSVCLIPTAKTNTVDTKYNASDLERNIYKTMPDTPHITSINNTDVPNIKEIIAQKQVFYITQDGNYAFFGNMVDMKTKRSLTQTKLADLNKYDFYRIPLNLSIFTLKKDNGLRKIAVFTDPDCPYCKAFELNTVPNLHNVSLIYFFYPLNTHPNSYTHTLKIICSKNSEHTFNQYTLDNKVRGNINTDCDDAQKLDKIINFVDKENLIKGTPTLVLDNGIILTGFNTAETINSQLNALPPEHTLY